MITKKIQNFQKDTHIHTKDSIFHQNRSKNNKNHINDAKKSGEMKCSAVEYLVVESERGEWNGRSCDSWRSHLESKSNCRSSRSGCTGGVYRGQMGGEFQGCETCVVLQQYLSIQFGLTCVVTLD